MSTVAGWRRIERVLVWLIAAHTLIVGATLLFAQRLVLPIAGWTALPDPFFPMQGGAFHLVVGAGYLVEYERHGTVTLIFIAKATATVFLGAVWLLATEPLPWAVPVSWAGDAAMGALVWAVHREASRGRA